MSNLNKIVRWRRHAIDQSYWKYGIIIKNDDPYYANDPNLSKRFPFFLADLDIENIDFDNFQLEDYPNGSTLKAYQANQLITPYDNIEDCEQKMEVVGEYKNNKLIFDIEPRVDRIMKKGIYHIG